MRLFFFLLFCSMTIAATAQDSIQVQLLGKYKFPDGSVVAEVVVTFENGGLTMTSSAGVSALELLKGDSFNIVSFNGTAVFKRNETKKVTGVHIEASGYVLDGVKDIAAAQGILNREQGIMNDELAALYTSLFVIQHSIFNIHSSLRLPGYN